MIHLTLTGYYAGTIICGAKREQDNEHYHAMYFSDWNNPELCQDCKKIYDECEPDSEEIEW